MQKPPDLIGQRVGEYEICSLIGVGGMGAVFEGRHPMIGKRVAVKVLLPDFSDSRELVERFIDEARAVNEIGHRGIVDIFAFGKLPFGSLYFVMELLNGLPLDRVIRQRGPVPVPEALAYVAEVAEALDAAHSVGIVHRDVKPSNIFVVSSPSGGSYVKLLDFGIAKLDLQESGTPKTLEGVALGTPDYMAPEQARGLGVTAATDLYALGCVLFELFTGRRVFKAPNAQRLMFMHAEDAPARPSSLRPDVPEAADELVLWLLEKFPDARPRSAREVVRHCAALRAELLDEPRPPTLPPIPVLRARAPSPEAAKELADAAKKTVPARGQLTLDPAVQEARSRRVKFDLAELEAGRVIRIARPERLEADEAPTGMVPVLLPAAAAPPALSEVPTDPRPAPTLEPPKTDPSAKITAPGLPFGNSPEDAVPTRPYGPGLKPWLRRRQLPLSIGLLVAVASAAAWFFIHR